MNLYLDPVHQSKAAPVAKAYETIETEISSYCGLGFTFQNSN